MAEGSDLRLDSTESKLDSMESMLDNSMETQFICTVCAETFKNEPAERHCEQCQQDLCTAHLQQHNQFDGMKSHKLVTKDEKGHSQRQQRELHKKYMCRIHPEKPLEIFCEECNILCCSVCTALEHRHCKHVTYILDISKNIRGNLKYKELRESLYQFKDELEILSTLRGSGSKSMKFSMESIEIMIRELRENLNQALDELEKKVREELKERYKKLQDRFKRDIQSLEEMIKKIGNKIEDLENKNNSDQQTFIECKTAERLLWDGRIFAEGHKASIGREKLDFTPNMKLINALTTAEKLGQFSERWISIGCMDFIGTIVKMIKTTDNNFLVIMKGKARSLLKLSSLLMKTDTFPLPWSPKCLSPVSEEEVALAYNVNPMTIDFFNYRDKLYLTRQVKVNSDIKQLVCYKDEIMVASPKYFFKDSQLNVYNLDGKLLKSFVKKDDTWMFSDIQDIAVVEDTGFVYICDTKKGLICMDQDGNILTTVKHANLQYPRAVCASSGGQVYVCGYASNNVYKLTADGENLQLVLGENSGVKAPTALYFDEQLSRLYIINDSENLQFFDII